MLAMVLERQGKPLVQRTLPEPVPGDGQILIEVSACGVCRTDLHIVDGDLPAHRLPLVPGHEVVGRIIDRGPGAARFEVGARVGVPWLGKTCQVCSYCGSERENLCDTPSFTGYDLDGGYAELIVADERYCFALPETLDDLHAAPLLCAGLIGHRALGPVQDAKRLGIYGFGASAHIVTQIARAQGSEVYAFVRPGDIAAGDFALSMGAKWVGPSNRRAPVELDAAIIFAPVGSLVPAALKALRKGGKVVCAGIHMSRIPAFPYNLLWGERSIQSIANLTRADGEAFFARLADLDLKIEVEQMPLRKANDALKKLRDGDAQGALVLTP